ncbi:arf-GAP with Rho-GAP domain, ANK repeat and PH domain-containing protein 2-like, partial [Sphaeramia orbicularis]|uniref:arf-GAP with Rho-GAP domain, ANK repeat and PH domain-containing protein 2-like n=1 Tax=Sphaeramia orbicularis TaxID=375764 RepID=UPI0011809798
MSDQDVDAVLMSDQDLDVPSWLSTLRLPQYCPSLLQGGYRTLQDCADLSDRRLLQLRVFPTGHRRRMLRSLEALGVSKDRDGGGGTPVLHPRSIFLTDRRRGTSCQHQKGRREDDLEGSQTLPPGAGLGGGPHHHQETRSLRRPQPAPRDPQNIGTSFIPPSWSSSSSSTSSESISISETPSDWDPGPEDPGPSTVEGQGGFQGEMVENSIYEGQPGGPVPKGPRPTRSYRLRHRPVPELPSQTPPLLQDRNAPPPSSPERRTGSEGPTGANGAGKGPLHQTLIPITPYGETFLYDYPECPAEQGTEGEPQQNQQDQQDRQNQQDQNRAQKHRPAVPLQLDSVDPRPSLTPDVFEDEYSTVDECSAVRPPGPAHSVKSSDAVAVASAPSGPGPGPGSGPHGGSLVMVDCDLYSEPADAVVHNPPLADISPYACFYGAPKHQVFKAGWLDKLSPQGKCVFQRRWVRFDGHSLSYYNNDKV